MDYRRPQHPRHVYHPSTPYVDIQNQNDSMTYSQCHPNYNDSSPWVMWQDRSSSPVVSLKKGKCCSALLGIVVFLAILTVMGIAGLAIYMGALKLDSAQYLTFDGSLRVTSGDSYNPSLSDHSSELYKKKFQFYKMLLQTIFKRSELGAALKHNTITGFAKGSLIVFFRLILDRRKIPKPLTNLEERARIVILQEFSSLIPSSPLQNLKIDSNQVYIRRRFESKGTEKGEIENSENNTTLQIKNGVLLRTTLHPQSPKYKSTPSEHLIISKPKKPELGFAQGSFVISSSETPITKNNSNEKSRQTIEHTTKTQMSISTQSIKPTSISSQPVEATTETLVNRLQHSPALNALLMQKQVTQKPVEVTQKNKPNLDLDLITLLPYNAPYAEEPWKPMLPENFTRYPQRRPATTTESFSSEGIGVVEVVLDPEEVYSKFSLPIEERTPANIKKEYLNLHNPLGENKQNISFSLRPSDSTVNEKSIFGPRSNDKISSFALHVDSTDDLTSKELETSIMHTNGGNILRRLENFPDFNNRQTILNPSPVTQYFPEFPIVQEFHKLDTLLRSYNVRSPSSSDSIEHKEVTNHILENITPKLPVTLLPVRSNSGIGKPLRPRPTVGSSNNNMEKHFLRISSSLTPSIVQTKFETSKDEPEDSSISRTNLHGLLSTTSDYTSSTNYFDSFIATITPSDFEENHKQSSSVEIKENNSEDTTQLSVDYSTGFTEISNQEYKLIGSTNTPYFNRERTTDQNLFYLTSSLNEETLSPTVEDIGTEDKTYFPEVYRQPKMATQFSTIVLPIKLPNEFNSNEESIPKDMLNSSVTEKTKHFNFGTYFELPVNVRSTDLDSNNNNSTISRNLKDNSMEDYLEKVIYNISTESSDNIETLTDINKAFESTTYIPYFFSQTNDSVNDTNLASDRKYEKADRNSITMDTSNLGFVTNFSFPYNSFHEDKNKNVTKNVNDSLKSVIESQNILKISTQLKQSGVNGNLNEDEAPAKTLFPSNNYVVNKSGLSILTKLLNKIPEQVTAATEKDISIKNNQSECFGNLSLQCGSGECVSALSRCNHLVDCTDGSDEKNCSCAEFLQSQFLTRKICDGVVDCWDFSDENNCDWCIPGQYVCTNSRVCVDQDRLCDGEKDCPNGDDEKSCVAITPDLPQSNTMAYISEGYLMIRKNGNWGNFVLKILTV